MRSTSSRGVFACAMAVVAAALLAAPAALAAEQVANPEYAQWAKFKAGTWVKYESVTEAAGQKTTSTMTHKLLAIDADKAEVETTTSMEVAGQKMDMPASKRTVPAKMDKAPEVAPPAGTEKPEMKEGEEECKVGDKAYKCKTVEMTMKQGGNTIKSKTWTTPEVPGGMVKMTSTMEGDLKSQTTVTMVGCEVAK